MSDAAAPPDAAPPNAAPRAPGSGHKGDRPRNVTIQATPTSVLEAPVLPRPTRTYRYPSGDVYTGEWLENRKHGRGVALYASGHRYEGEWKNDKKDGHGTFTYDQGTSYTGSWKDDMKHGHGVALFASGNRYEGDWVNDNMHGQGSFIYGTSGGDTYTGSWVHGKMSGTGTWTSGQHISRYEGEWLNGVRHGCGLLFSYGRVLEVTYENGHVVHQRLVTVPVPLVDVPAPIYVVVDLQASSPYNPTTPTTLTLQSGQGTVEFDDITTPDKSLQPMLERLTKDLLAGFHCTLAAYSATGDFLTAVSSKVATGFVTLLLHGLRRQDGSSKNSSHQHEGVVSLCLAAVSPAGVCCDLLDPSRGELLAIRDPGPDAPLSGFHTEEVHSPMELQTLQARAAAVRCGPGCLRCMQITVTRRLVPKSGTDPPYQSEVRALFLDLPTLSESVLFCKDLAVEPALPPSVGHLAAHITTGNSKTMAVAVVPMTMTTLEGDRLLQHAAQLRTVCKKVTPNQLLPVDSPAPRPPPLAGPAREGQPAPAGYPITVQPPSPPLAVPVPVQDPDLPRPMSLPPAAFPGEASGDTEALEMSSPLDGCMVETLPPLHSSLTLSPHGRPDFLHLAAEHEAAADSGGIVVEEVVPEAFLRPAPDPLLARLRGSGFVARRVAELSWPDIAPDPSLRDAPFDTCLGRPLLPDAAAATAEAPDDTAPVPGAYVRALQQRVQALERLLLRQQQRHSAEVADFCADVDFLLALLTPQQTDQVVARFHPRSALLAFPPPPPQVGVPLVIATPPMPSAGHGKGRASHQPASDSDDSSDDSDSSARSAAPAPASAPATPHAVPAFVQQLREMGFPQAALDALLLRGPPLSNTDAVFEWLTYYHSQDSADPSPAPDPTPLSLQTPPPPPP
eukprot:EG_transcript_2648